METIVPRRVPAVLRKTALVTTFAAAALLTNPFAGAAHAAAPPSCVTLTKNATSTVLTVKNNCTTTVTVRVRVSASLVLSCSSYAPGQTRVFAVSPPAPAAKLETC
jgi:hypothetical protein